MTPSNYNFKINKDRHFKLDTLDLEVKLLYNLIHNIFLNNLKNNKNRRFKLGKLDLHFSVRNAGLQIIKDQ